MKIYRIKVVWKDSKTISNVQISSEVAMEEDADSDKQMGLLSISSIQESTPDYNPDLEMRKTRFQIEPVYYNLSAEQR